MLTICNRAIVGGVYTGQTTSWDGAGALYEFCDYVEVCISTLNFNHTLISNEMPRTSTPLLLSRPVLLELESPRPSKGTLNGGILNTFLDVSTTRSNITFLQLTKES